MRRGASAVLTAAAALAGLLVATEPVAAACDCAIQPTDRQEQLAPGSSVAVLQRIDRDNDDDAGYRVEATNGGVEPGETYFSLQEDVGCTGVIEYGWVFAARVEPGGEIDYTPCGEVDLQQALAVIDGPTKPVSAGPVVAVAAGNYGDHSLVALNALGQPVAWAAHPGRIDRLAVCPGGRTVVVVGVDRDEAQRRVDVVDAATLRLRRTIVPAGTGGGTTEVACADSAGERAALFLAGPIGEHSDESPNSVVEIRGTSVEEHDTGTWSYVSVVSSDGGFLASNRRGDGTFRLVRVATDGRLTELHRYPQFHYLGDFALSPDGRTLAARADVKTSSGTALVLIDAATGRIDQQGDVGLRGVDVRQLGWTAAGHLLVSTRTEPACCFKVSPPDRVLEYDGSLHLVGEREGGPGSSMEVVGDSAVFFSPPARPSYVNANYLPRDLDVRLTETWVLKGLGLSRTTELPPVSRTNPARVAMLFLTGIAAVGGMALGARRVRSHPAGRADSR
jgi:hypothetical protein